MRMVIDSNRLIAGILRDSICRKILLDEHIEFYSPDYLLVEVNKYRDYLSEKSGMTPRQIDEILAVLKERVTLVPYEQFEHELDIAKDIIGEVDIKDAPFIAVGLALTLDGIWTEDRDFNHQKVLRVFSTREIVEILSGR